MASSKTPVRPIVIKEDDTLAEAAGEYATYLSFPELTAQQVRLIALCLDFKINENGRGERQRGRARPLFAQYLPSLAFSHFSNSLDPAR